MTPLTLIVRAIARIFNFSQDYFGKDQCWHEFCFSTCIVQYVLELRGYKMSEPVKINENARCNNNIRQVLEYARQLIILADEGEAESKDNGCSVLYGVVRDCAYKIRAEAERERESHKASNRWDPD